MPDGMFETPMRERTIAACFAKQAGERPEALALVDGDGRTVTYAQAEEGALKVGTGLTDLGVSRQDPVLVMLDNHVDNVLVWLGLGLYGQVHVPINTAFKGDLLAYVAAHSGAKVAVIESTYLPRFTEISHLVPDLQTVVVRNPGPESATGPLCQVPLEDLFSRAPARPQSPPEVWDIASILYTSGTTGPSKGVRCPHGQAFAASSALDVRPGSATLVTLPLFHATGLWTGVFNALRVGGTAVIQATFSTSAFWDQVRRHNCTSTVLLGGTAEFLWNQPASPTDGDNPLETAVILPAPADPAAWSARFGAAVSTGYGLSEVGVAAVTVPGDPGPLRCGRPRPYLQARIVDDNDIEVPPGATGELTLRSAEPWLLMTGYHRMPEETTQAFRNLWLHTGDLMYADPSGQLVFVDRKKDSVRRRGENVSTFEVEAHLLKRDDIAEAAVIPVPGEFADDEIKAVVVLAPGASFDPEAVLRDLYGRMPYFMVPRYYEAVAGFPRTPTHKVKKHELRELGVTPGTWDCEAAGFLVKRDRLVTPEPATQTR